MSCSFNHKDSNVKYDTNKDLVQFYKNNNFVNFVTNDKRILSKVELFDLVSYYKYAIGVSIAQGKNEGNPIGLEMATNKHGVEFFNIVKYVIKKDLLKTLPESRLKENILHSLDQYETFINFFNIVSKLNINSNLEFDEENNDENNNQDEDEEQGNNKYQRPDDKRGDSTSLWDLAPNDIKFLFSTLVKVKQVTTYYTDKKGVKHIKSIDDKLQFREDGLPIVVNPISYLTRLIKEFQGMNSENFEKKFYGEAILKTYPELAQLRNIFPNINSVDKNKEFIEHTIEEINMIVRLENFLTKPLVEYRQGEIKEIDNKSTYSYKLLTFDNYYKIENRFKNNPNFFSKESMQVKGGYVEIDENGNNYYVNLPKLDVFQNEADIKKLISDKYEDGIKQRDSIKLIMDVLGFDLSELMLGNKYNMLKLIIKFTKQYDYQLGRDFEGFDTVFKMFYLDIVTNVENRKQGKPFKFHKSIFEFAKSQKDPYLRNKYNDQLRDVIEAISSLDEEVATLSTRTSEGERAYTVNVPSSMLVFKNEINNAESKESFYAKYPDLLTSNYFQATDLALKGFSKNSSKSNEYSKNADRDISLSNYGGFINKSTKNLTDFEKTIFDFNNLYRYGHADIPRTASSSTYYAFSYTIAKGGIYVANKFQSTNDKTGVFSRRAKEKLLEYVKAEIKNNELFLFKDIYTKEEFTIIKKLFNDTGFEQLTDIDNNLILNPLNEYFNNMYDEYSDKLVNLGLISESLDKVLNDSLIINTNKVDGLYANEKLSDVIWANVINNFINNIEAAIIFTGDIRAISDFNKRFKAFISSGEKPSTSAVVNRFLNIEFKEYYNIINYISGISLPTDLLNDNKFATKVLKEATSTSSYLPLMIEDLGLGGEELNTFTSAYTNMKIGDGQGYCTLEFYKEIITRVYGWDDYKETSYTYEKNISALKYGKLTITERKELEEDQADFEKEMVSNPGKYTFPPLKLQYAGLVIGGEGKSAIDKFSIMPLLPSMLNTKTKNLLQQMYKDNTGYVMYESASKAYKGKNDAESFDVLVKYMEYAKIQLRNSDKFKKETGWGSQFRKMLFTSLFENGQAKSIKSKELYSTYVTYLGELADVNKELLFSTLGVKYEITETKKIVKKLINGKVIDVEDNIKDFKLISLDNKLLVNAIQKELRRRGDDETAVSYDHLSDKAFNMLDFTGKHTLINDIVFGLFDKTLRTFKIKGNDYVQFSNSMYDKLAFYSLNEDKSKVNKAEVRISLQGEFLKLLKLKHNDKQPIRTVTRLNEMLNDKSFSKRHEKSLTIAGYRIPTQGPNSMEILIIKEFLPSTTGNVIQLYDEIVAKSGADFDIDKLRLFLPYLDDNGEYIDESTIAAINDEIKALEKLYPGIKSLAYDKMINDKEDDKEELNLDNLDLKALLFRGDINSPEQLEGLFDEYNEKFKRYKSLLNNKFGLSINKFMNLFEEVLTLPELYKTLVTPNNADIIKKASNDSYNKLSKKQSFEEASAYPKGIDVFHIVRQSEVTAAMVGGKNWVGLFAKVNPQHQLSLQNRLELNKRYNINQTTGTFDTIILGLSTKEEKKQVERLNSSRNIIIKFDTDDAVMQTIDENNLKTNNNISIGDVISNGLTGAVDVEGNKHITLSPINDFTFNHYIFSLKAKVPLNRIFDFLNTNVYNNLNSLIAQGLSSKNAYLELIDILGVSADEIKDVYYDLENNPITQEEIDFDLSYYKLKAKAGENENEIKRLQEKYIKIQLRILSYSYYLNQHGSQLSGFFQVFDQDTTKIPNAFANHIKLMKINDVRKTGFITNDALSRYMSFSIISPFVKNQQFIKTIGEEILPVLNDKVFIEKVLRDGKIKKAIYYKGARDFGKIKMTQTLQSDYIFSIIQNFGKTSSGKSLIDELKGSLITNDSDMNFLDTHSLFKDLFPENYEMLSKQFRWIEGFNRSSINSPYGEIGSVEIKKQLGNNIDEVDLYRESMAEAMNEDNIEFTEESGSSIKEIKEFFVEMRDKLYYAGIAQGFTRNQYYFENIVPNRFKLDIYKSASDKFVSLSKEEQSRYISSFLYLFKRNNPDLVIYKETDKDIIAQIGIEQSKRFKVYILKEANSQITALQTQEKSQDDNSKTPIFNTLPFKSVIPTFTYAGIGSRETPQDVLNKMTEIAKYLEEKGYTLRSGGAQGADTAFENGSKTKEIFLGSTETGKEELQIAREIHPSPISLDNSKNPKFIWNLMARNTNQIFGKNLDTPVDFVIAWTKDGLTDYKNRTINSGGTGQAIDMASRKNIPIINMFNDNWKESLKTVLDNNVNNTLQSNTNNVKDNLQNNITFDTNNNQDKTINNDEIRRLGEIIFETGQDSTPNDNYRNIRFSEEFSMLGSTPRFIQTGIDIYSTNNGQRKSSISDINGESSYNRMLQKTIGEIWDERNTNKDEFRIYVQAYIAKQINGKYRGISEKLAGNDFYERNYRVNFTNLIGNKMQALENGTIEVDSKQFSEVISQSSDFKSVREYIDLVLLEEMIHLFQFKSMSKDDYNNIYNELSQKEINDITNLYNRNKKQLSKEDLVDEYIRMLVQNNLTGKSSEVYLKNPKKTALQIIYKLFRDILDALSFKPYSKEISDKYTNEIKSLINNNISKEELINAINKNKENIKGIYKSLFNIEGNEIETAENIYDQLTSSESEAKTARDIVGNEIADAVLNYFANRNTQSELDNNLTNKDITCQ